MEKLNPGKLSVSFECGLSLYGPAEGRKYTLTHSDQTGQLFLMIRREYAYEKITSMRDEVLGLWLYRNRRIVFQAYVHVDDVYQPGVSEKRNAIFVKELPLALGAIRYGDRQLFSWCPELDAAPIWVFFQSGSPSIMRNEYFGPFSKYR
ncbi:staygreen family protein [Metabacillus sp. GX 13764]|uniref:staygreen family protein n=1 Tax=Metabacillus kandeliae TaxID=2900151 RepID=UPI001E3F9A5F|nr:staygreen family protein [Metabacillus kandeliae]MCD7036516.1 staygreen family protein [Metabacillus kandeliae]